MMKAYPVVLLALALLVSGVSAYEEDLPLGLPLPEKNPAPPPGDDNETNETIEPDPPLEEKVKRRSSGTTNTRFIDGYTVFITKSPIIQLTDHVLLRYDKGAYFNGVLGGHRLIVNAMVYPYEIWYDPGYQR